MFGSTNNKKPVKFPMVAILKSKKTLLRLEIFRMIRSSKFQFSAIEFVKVIWNKPFFPLKALNPGLKLLEMTIPTNDRDLSLGK